MALHQIAEFDWTKLVISSSVSKILEILSSKLPPLNRIDWVQKLFSFILSWYELSCQVSSKLAEVIVYKA